MAAPLLKPGQRGETIVVGQKLDAERKWKKITRGQKAERFRARCYFRGHDGIVRELSRVAPTREAAVESLDRAVREATSSVEGMTADMPFVAAVRHWLDLSAVPASGLSERTIVDYRATVRRYIDSPTSVVRGLTLREANDPQRLRALLQYVADHHGTGAAHQTRTVLTNVLGLAVDNGVLTTSAIRQVRRVQAAKPKPVTRKAGPRDTRRAFTKAERDAVVAYADNLARAEGVLSRTTRKRETAADLLAFLSGTGCRVSEARRMRWEDVDLTRGRVEVVQAKTRAGLRTLTLPGWLADRMRERAERVGTEAFVFAAPHHVGELAGHVEWDQSNCASTLAAILDGAGHGWATPHSFRRTVATLAAGGGAPLVDIADQLGHADPAMTARVYLGRDPFGERASVAQHL